MRIAEYKRRLDAISKRANIGAATVGVQWDPDGPIMHNGREWATAEQFRQAHQNAQIVSVEWLGAHN